MNREDIIETPIWQLYDKGRNYLHLTGVYTDTDRNYRFYNGNQWEGAKLGDVEPVQKNFIKPIVNYKLAVIHANLYAPKFSSQNYESHELHKKAEKVCEMLNGYALRVWEQDQLDKKCRKVTKDAAINDEGIFYVDFDDETMMPKTEVIDKNDIYYGNENDDDIQSQPYILIRKRMPVANAIELALNAGMSESKTDLIIGDYETFEQSGDASKQEVDNQVTVVYKMYKKNGTIHFSIATRYCEIVNDIDLEIKLYPIAHFIWQEKKGSARGEGEVRYLIPNQIEVNRTEVRRVMTVKLQAYPHKIVDTSKVINPQALNTVGGIIKTNDKPVEDVHKIVGTLPPAQMSPDVVKLQEDLIAMSRELAGAGETANGDVDPENASGRAILAVQQASQAPVTEQKDGFKATLEDLTKIWLEYLIAHAVDGVNLEEKTTTENGEEMISLVNVSQKMLEQLKASVKIDITPISPVDKFAQEQTLENYLLNGLFSIERLGELEAYVNALPDDSVAPKMKLLEIIESRKEEQRKIAMIQADAQMMQQRAQQFIMDDLDGQAQQIADAQSQIAEEEELPEEEEYEEKEAELDEQIADEVEELDEE